MKSPLDMKNAFKALSAIPLDVLQKIAGEAIQEFLPLQEELLSEDPKKREEAMKKAEELQSKMASLLMKTYKDAGVDLSDLVSTLKKQAN